MWALALLLGVGVTTISCGATGHGEAGGAAGGVAAGTDARVPTYPFSEWGDVVRNGVCSHTTLQRVPTPRHRSLHGAEGTPLAAGAAPGVLTCAVVAGIKVFSFPAGVFEIDEQLLVPANTAIVGANR